MKMRKEVTARHLVFYLEGELTAKDKPRFMAEALADLEEKKDVSAMAVVVEKMTYIDSAGLGALLELKDRAMQKGKEFILIGITDYLNKLLQVTHLTDAFTSYPDIDSFLGRDRADRQTGRMEIPSELEYVSDVSRRIIDTIQRYGLSNEILMDMRLAVEEAVINGIRHGNKFDKQKLVLIEYEATPEGIEIIVQDEGDGFDYENTRGKGLSLVFHIMDSVEYENGGTLLKMKKYFKAA